MNGAVLTLHACPGCKAPHAGEFDHCASCREAMRSGEPVDLELAAWARRLAFTCGVCGCKAVRQARCGRCGAHKADMPIPLVPVEALEGVEVVAVDVPAVDWSRVTLDPRLEELGPEPLEDGDHDDDGSHGGAL